MAAEQFNTFVLAAPVATTIAGTESVPLIQGGVTKQVSPAVLLGAGDPHVDGAPVALTGQVADIPTTPLLTPTVKAAYRVTVMTICTTDDAAAGQLQVTMGFNDDAGAEVLDPAGMVPLTPSFAGKAQVSRIFAIQASPGGPITYEITHTGIYGTAVYSLYIVVEKVADL